MRAQDIIKKVFLGLLACVLTTAVGFAQEDKYKDYREVYHDTVDMVSPTELAVRNDTIFNPLQVVTNKFDKNWFLFATGGAHTFLGDYSGLGDFKGTLSPDWGIGVGKWFTPGVALKLEFIHSNSRGYTDYKTGNYGYGDVMETESGIPYRKMKTEWIDLSASAILNLTRLFYGYEGYGSKKRMNQFMTSFGIGGVHHLAYGSGHESDNEWSAHIELQYSRFFTPKKCFSLDLKLRGLFYQTNFDLEHGQADYAAAKWDANIGVNLGFTFYLDRRNSNRWKRGTQTVYQRDYRKRKIPLVKAQENVVEHNALTFYVFFPNNYSGHNDAPLVADAQVNAIDYLAGGLFTQKQYVHNSTVKQRLDAGLPLTGLDVKDLPTERANQAFAIDYVPRGYELSASPMAFSQEGHDLRAFGERAGFYYAPIFDGPHTWKHRIDRSMMGQKLLNEANYKEKDSYSLNAHAGLGTVREHMNIDKGDLLVSFADMYAAMQTNEGYISQYTNTATVEYLRRVFDRGTITMIQVEGLAVSQDNYSEDVGRRVDVERNTALSQNRASTVVSWLQEKPRLKDAASHIFLVNSLQEPIREVNDTSIRDLVAKLNRCVKVRIHYMLK